MSGSSANLGRRGLKQQYMISPPTKWRDRDAGYKRYWRERARLAVTCVYGQKLENFL